MSLGRILYVAFLSTTMFFLVAPPANAYIDPGSGSLIFQAVIGGLLAAGVTAKVFWRRIKARFSSRHDTDEE